MKVVRSFGVVPLRKEKAVWHVLMIRHRKGSYWGFPKGHGEEGESSWQSAVRELKEETGLEVIKFLKTEPLIEQYSFFKGTEQVKKIVTYFVALVGGELQLQVEEVAEAQWFSLQAAMGVLTFAESRHLCQQVITLLSDG